MLGEYSRPSSTMNPIRGSSSPYDLRGLAFHNYIRYDQVLPSPATRMSDVTLLEKSMTQTVNENWQQAVRDIDVTTMKALLAVDPNLVNQGIVHTRANGTTYSKSPLRMVNNSLDAARLLLDAGADPNDGADAGLAILKASPEVADYLLDAGADVNRIGNEQGTALMFEVEMNNAELIQLYVDRGANVNYQREMDGNCALHFAARLGFENIVNVLLNGGADPTVKNNDGQTALDIAKKLDAKTVIARLEKIAR